MDANRNKDDLTRRERILEAVACLAFGIAVAWGMSFIAIGLGALLGFIMGWIDRGRDSGRWE